MVALNFFKGSNQITFIVFILVKFKNLDRFEFLQFIYF